MSQHLFTNVETFVRHLAVHGIAHGYYFYVSGWIPEDKDPRRVDAKLLGRYHVTESKWVRHRRRKRGEAAVRYLRLGHFFVLMSTVGQHPFFELESTIEDFRRTSLRFHGMRVGAWKDSQGKWHPSVKLGPGRLAKLQTKLACAALNELQGIIQSVPCRRFKPVQWQLRKVLRNAGHPLDRCRPHFGLCRGESNEISKANDPEW